MTASGRFLEISVQAQDVLESLAFYKGLGFSELAVSEVWSHRYAVVSDGRTSVGLHGRAFDSPAICFVRPELAAHARTMMDSGFTFSFLRLDEDVFNEASLVDPDGTAITLMEAATFMRPDEDSVGSACGRFLEFAVPVRDVVRSGRFWAGLVSRLVDHREQAPAHMRFDAGGITLGFSENPALRQPALCFCCDDRERLDQLAAQAGIAVEECADFEGAFARLTAPEGTPILLFDSDFLGGAYVDESSPD